VALGSWLLVATVINLDGALNQSGPILFPAYPGMYLGPWAGTYNLQWIFKLKKNPIKKLKGKKLCNTMVQTKRLTNCSILIESFTNFP
jgi:hypothetical protein